MSSDSQAAATVGREQRGQYLVVARRYRPRSFEELLGQDHIAQALRNSILTQRVGHAYLFTGARGVGKTSAARIFAKALNCVQGPSPVPDNTCDICLSIDAGEDVDVLEIDGASNRGIEEIRQLRSNAHVRPSRAPYKIYIIDEVHMLTNPAFNALLKTLEEPPEHVKFIFCTTDPEKIPITVLSRCQRYDFAPIEESSITDRLRFILSQEGRGAEDAALALLARRAEGSMRDSQSLLEQLLAFGGEHITVQDVYAMLGTADTGLLQELAEQLLQGSAGDALRSIDKALRQGAEAGHLAEQLLGYFRDMLVATAGGPPDLALQMADSDWPQLRERGNQVGMETMMAIAQILDQTLVRMRQSTHGRMLLELAAIRIAGLERLDDLAEVVQALRAGQPVDTPVRTAKSPAAAGSPAAEKKTPEANSNNSGNGSEIDGGERIALTSATAASVWQLAVARLDGILGEMARSAERVAISAPNRLVVAFPAGYNLQREGCERPDRKSKIEGVLRQITGSDWQLEFQLQAGTTPAPPEPTPVRSARQRKKDVERHELVSRAVELFDAEVLRVDVPRPADP
jgi:DNA polymerase III subunit gamma/tau